MAKSAKCPLNSLSYINKRSQNYNGADKQSFIRERVTNASNLYRSDLEGHFGCVNAIEFSNHGGEFMASGGDDRRILLWSLGKAMLGKGQPQTMKGEHNSNIFCLDFNHSDTKVFSGGNDEQVIVHDTETGQTVDVYLHQDAVYGISADPVNESVFASACDDGRILIYDTRAAAHEDPFLLASYSSPMHAVMYNPAEPRLLATANSKEGLGLWDIRKPKISVMRYGGIRVRQNCMSVRISQSGDSLIALRRRLPPVLYKLNSPDAVCMFDHNGYYNSCTMKSCCFAGDKDQYILSGSDDFNLYMWRIPDDPEKVSWVGEAHIILRGHRSVVNQVRCNPSNNVIVSSGVEKVIKMWSPFSVPKSEGHLDKCNLEPRPNYTHEEYINLVLRSGQIMSHDFSQHSTKEDPRMLAFFDSLVQRELEGWTSDESQESKPAKLSTISLTHSSDSDTSLNSAHVSTLRPLQSTLHSPPLSTVGQSYVELSTVDQGVSVSGSDVVTDHALLDNVDNNSGSGTSSSEDDTGYSSPFSIAFASVMASRWQDLNAEFDRQNSSRATTGGSSSRDNCSGKWLPGQSVTASRKSISKLITQKRKEYISSIKKTQLTSNKVKTKRKQHKFNKKSRISRVLRLSSIPEVRGSSSSSTDDSDCGSSDKKPVSSSSTSSSSSSSSSSDGDHEQAANVFATIIANQKKKSECLSRLKHLRQQAVSSEIAIIGETPETSHPRLSNLKVTTSTYSSETVDETNTTTANGKINSDYVDRVPQATVIKEADCKDCCDSTSTKSTEALSTCQCGSAKDTSSIINSPAVSNVRKSEPNHSDSNSTGISNVLVIQPTNLTTNGSSRHSDSAEVDPPTTWRDFRRYCNHVEKSHRRYRPRKASDRRSSDDES